MAQNQEADLPADTIIEILQSNPDLLEDAKSEIVDQLRARGYSVSEKDITDDRLFGQIRSDDRVRHVMSDELKARGFGAEQAETTQQEGTGNSQPAQQDQNAGPATGTGRGNSSQGQLNDNGNAPNRRNGQRANDQRQQGAVRRPKDVTSAQKIEGNVQEQYPLRDLPAIRDLYRQAVTEPSKLERFGAALFRNSGRSPSKTPLDIPVGPDYVIGPGDELVVSYWGSSSQRVQLTVDREGRIVLPESGTLIVAGRTLGDTEQAVQKLMSRQLKGITVDVTLGKLRTVRTYVVGDVKEPAAYDISSLSTALSALIVAGGPTETGSYRTVKHYRGKTLVEEVDLYELMLRGVSSAQVHIESGDSIMVPPVGRQVTVTGAVRRPAIYELRSEQTLDQVIELAGGVPVTAEFGTVKVERIEAHQRKEMLSVSVPNASDFQSAEGVFKRFQVQDGDIVTVGSILPYSNRAVYLQGHVFRPGKYPFKDGTKVTDLVTSFADILPEPADRAEIVRLQPPDYTPVVIGFNLRDVLAKKAEAPSLEPFDTLRIFGRYETDAPKVSIFGEVLRPGEYPLGERMTAVELLRMAGGFKRSAFREKADLASYTVIDGDHVDLEHHEIPIGRAAAGEADTDVVLKPGDVLTVSQIGGWTDIGGAITLAGEVQHPGRYGIQRGEKLSSILRRAGGFSAEAYPYGALLDRAQIREFAAKSREDMLNTLQDRGATTTDNRTSTLAAARQRRELEEKLKSIQPSGRMLIHITTQIDKWQNTPMDVEVRPGDTLLIPKRPNFVMVAGQVYNPAAITFSPGKHASWYLRQAGGPTSTAKKKEIIVVRANGTVVGRGSSGLWSGDVLSAVLQPGDTVFVPEKVAGGGIYKNLTQSIQLLSGAAVAVSVIRTF